MSILIERSVELGISNYNNLKLHNKLQLILDFYEMRECVYGAEKSALSIDVHHVFPQAHLDYFTRCGVNIHEPKYLSWWDGVSHRQNANGYDKLWDVFKYRNPNPTIESVLEYGKEIMSGHGISVHF